MIPQPAGQVSAVVVPPALLGGAFANVVRPRAEVHHFVLDFAVPLERGVPGEVVVVARVRLDESVMEAAIAAMQNALAEHRQKFSHPAPPSFWQE